MLIVIDWVDSDFSFRFKSLSNNIISEFQLSKATTDYVKTVKEFVRLLYWRIHIIQSLSYPETTVADT